MSESNSLTKQEREPDGLPALFAKMADQLTQLFDTKLSLLRVELKEEVSIYTRGAVTMVIGGVVVVVGLALLNVAIAFLVSTVFESSNLSQPVRYALGFIIIALVYAASRPFKQSAPSESGAPNTAMNPSPRNLLMTP